MTSLWIEDYDKVARIAKAERKLLVTEYDATIDSDIVSAMSPDEFSAAKAKYDKRSVQGGWISIAADYTSPLAELKFELNRMEKKKRTSVDFTIGGKAYHVYGVLRDRFVVQVGTQPIDTAVSSEGKYCGTEWQEIRRGNAAEIVNAVQFGYSSDELGEMSVNARYDADVLNYCYAKFLRTCAKKIKKTLDKTIIL